MLRPLSLHKAPAACRTYWEAAFFCCCAGFLIVMLSWVQKWLSQSHEVFAAISLAVANDPRAPFLFVIGGGLLFTMIADLRNGRFSKSSGLAKDLSGGFSLKKGGPVANHYERAHAYLSSGDAGRAIESFSKALRLNPSYADALIGRGFALLKKGDYENAMADLSEAIYLAPKSGKAYFYRGNVLGAKGDYAGAVADYDCSLRLEPGKKRVRAARELAMVKLTASQA